MGICNGVVTDLPHLRTTHEEADAVIIHQVVYLARSGKNSIRVIADVTDVFVLQIHYYRFEQLSLVMISGMCRCQSNSGKTYGHNLQCFQMHMYSLAVTLFLVHTELLRNSAQSSHT